MLSGFLRLRLWVLLLFPTIHLSHHFNHFFHHSLCEYWNRRLSFTLLKILCKKKRKVRQLKTIKKSNNWTLTLHNQINHVGWDSKKQKANNRVGGRCSRIRQGKRTITHFKVKFKTTLGKRKRERRKTEKEEKRIRLQSLTLSRMWKINLLHLVQFGQVKLHPCKTLGIAWDLNPLNRCCVSCIKQLCVKLQGFELTFARKLSPSPASN